MGDVHLGLTLGLRFLSTDVRGQEITLGWLHEGEAIRLVAGRRADRSARPEPAWSSEIWPPPHLVDWVAAVLGRRIGVPSGWIAAREAAERAGGFDVPLSTWDGMSRDEAADGVAQLGGHLVADPRSRRDSAAGWLPAAFSFEPSDSCGAAVKAAIETVIASIADAATDALAGLTYLGPARSAPPRLIAHSGGGAKDLGPTGSLMAARLAGDPGLQSTVNRHLAALRLNYSIDVGPLDVDDPLLREAYAIRLLDHRYEEPLAINVADVGYGISQVLPVIVAGAVSPGGTVMVEQPELHIHPGLQARYGQILVEQSASTRFIIETHSEHLMLRLLRNVRGGMLDAQDVSVLHVGESPTGSGSVLTRLEIDEAGEFLDWWPDGFFSERDEELFEPPPA
jgi:hypothetical protein